MRLLDVIRSPIHWTPGHIFRVHPFSGELKARTNNVPEHLIAGEEYLIDYTYHKVVPLESYLSLSITSEVHV